MLPGRQRMLVSPGCAVAVRYRNSWLLGTFVTFVILTNCIAGNAQILKVIWA